MKVLKMVAIIAVIIVAIGIGFNKLNGRNTGSSDDIKG